MAKTRIAMIAAAVMSTSLLGAVPARADDSSDFLNKVSAEGINVGDTPEDVEITLAAAEDVCITFHNGYPTEVARRQAHYWFPNATSQQLASFVDAAQATLCAHAYAPVPANGGY